MREQTFSRLVLPVCFVVAALGVIGLSSIMLDGHLLNPVPSYPYCLVGIYPPVQEVQDQVQMHVTSPPTPTTPIDIDVDVDIDTSSPSDYTNTNTSSSMEELSPPNQQQVIEDNDNMKTFDSLFATLLITATVIILCSMLLVTLAVFKVERQARRDSLEIERVRSTTRSDSNPNSNPNSDLSPHPFARTRATLRQALMYIGAFLLTWGWVGVTMAIPVTSPFWDAVGTSGAWRYIPDQIKFTLMPLQGFFNASIFIYSKVYILWQSESSSSSSSSSSSLTVWQAIKRVILAPKSIPDILVSRIDIVFEDVEGNHHHHNNHMDGGGNGNGNGGQDLVRRGVLVRRVDETYDLESMDTPSVGMVLSAVSITTLTNNNRKNNPNSVSNNNDDDDDDDNNTGGGPILGLGLGLKPEDEHNQQHSPQHCKDLRVKNTSGDEEVVQPRSYYQWTPSSDWNGLIEGNKNNTGKEELEMEGEGEGEILGHDEDDGNSRHSNLSTGGILSWASLSWVSLSFSGRSRSRNNSGNNDVFDESEGDDVSDSSLGKKVQDSAVSFAKNESTRRSENEVRGQS